MQKVSLQSLQRRKTIPFNFGEKHKLYIQKCQYCTFNILEGAVRSGKTVDNIFAFAHELRTTPDRIHLATGSTMGNAKLNLGDANGFGLEWIFRGQCRWTKYHNLDALVIQGPMTNFKQKIVIFSGAGNQFAYQKIRGNSYGMWIATEINLHHDNMIKEAFNRTIAAKRRKFFWDLNPDNPGASIYVDYIDRYRDLDAEGKLLGGYNYEHFTLFDNVNIPDERRNEVISQYDEGSIWYARDIEGQRVAAQGLIYPMYESVFAAAPKLRAEQYVLSLDYGTMNAFAAGLWGKYGDAWFMVDEYYYSGRDEGILKTDEDYAQALEDWLGFLFSGEAPMYSEYSKLRTIVDPSAKSFIVLLRRRRVFRVIPAANAVLDGIRDTATCMKTGKIKIDPRCRNWLKEVRSYLWDDKATEDRPIKKDDHHMDQTRYFCETMNLVKKFRRTSEQEE